MQRKSLGNIAENLSENVKRSQALAPKARERADGRGRQFNGATAENARVGRLERAWTPVGF